jgi:hypothetical protein
MVFSERYEYEFAYRKYWMVYPPHKDESVKYLINKEFKMTPDDTNKRDSITRMKTGVTNTITPYEDWFTQVLKPL